MRRFRSDERGVVSVEFALSAVFLMTAMLNAADVGDYVYKSMQVENGAQMAAQTALQACTVSQVPVTTSCPGFAGKASTAVASTSLGASLTLDGGAVTEAYFCVDTTGKLTQVGTIGKAPATCSSVGNASAVPGVYVVAAVSYSFEPMLDGAGVAALLTSPIRRSAIMRVG